MTSAKRGGASFSGLCKQVSVEPQADREILGTNLAGNAVPVL